MEIDQSFKFLHPFTLNLVGGTGSGKTYLVYRILKHTSTLFSVQPQNLVVLYSQYQPIYEKFKSLDQFKSITIEEGVLHNFESLEDCVLVVDDQMTQLMKSAKLQEVFTKLSHHNNVSIITLTQNLFPAGKYSKDIRLNLHYYVIMKSFTLQAQVKHLGLQIYPLQKRFLSDAYKKATVNNFSYLVVILHPQWNDHLRVVTQIFPPNDLVVFIPSSP